MFKARTLREVKDDLSRQLRTRVALMLVASFVVILGLLATGIEQLFGIGFSVVGLGLLFLFIYGLFVLPNRFASGYTRSEVFKWTLDRLCNSLGRSIESGGGYLSRYLARRVLYDIATLFESEWEWEESDPDSKIDDDLFQGSYLDFSFTLKDVSARMNHFLLKAKDMPQGVLKNLQNLRDSLDESHQYLNEEQLGYLQQGIKQLSMLERDGVDDGFYFAIRGESVRGAIRGVLKSPFGTFAVTTLFISLVIFLLVPWLLSDLETWHLFSGWIVFVATAAGIIFVPQKRRGLRT